MIMVRVFFVAKLYSWSYW